MVEFLGKSLGSHFQRISTPRKRYDFERAIAYSRSGLNSCWPKISGSGWKVMVVPRRLGAAPLAFNLVFGLPREKACVHDCLSRATSTTSSSESALTTETPTPCRPPEVA